MVKIMM